MGIKLGDAFVFIKGDNKGLKKSFAESEGDTRKWTARLAGGITKLLGTGVAAGAAAAGAAVAALGAAFVKATVDAAGVEGIRTTFFELADGAKLAELRTASMNRVLDTDLMKAYNQATLAVSKSFADELPGAMQYMGKIADATGQDVTYLLDSYQLGIARLSPMILDNLGIQTNLTQANEDYAAQLGVSVESLTKEQQQLALNAQVMTLLEEKTEGMADMSNGAKASMDKLKVAGGNLFQALGRIGVPILTAFLVPLANFATRIAPIVEAKFEDIAEKVGAFFEVIKLGVNPIDAFITLLGRLGLPPDILASLRGFVGFLREAWAVIQSGENVLGGLWAMVQPKLAEFWTNFQAWFAEIDWGAVGKQVIEWVVFGFVGAALFDSMKPELEAMWASFQLWFTETDWKQVGIDVVTFIVEGLADFTTTVVETFATWAQAFSDWVATVDWYAIGYDIVEFIIEGLVAFVTTVATTLTDWYTAVKDGVDGMTWGEIGGNIVTKIVDGLVAAGGAIFTALAGIIQGAIDAAIAQLTGGGGSMGSNTGGANPAEVRDSNSADFDTGNGGGFGSNAAGGSPFGSNANPLGGNGPAVVVYATVNNGQDVEALAWRVANVMQARR